MTTKISAAWYFIVCVLAFLSPRPALAQLDGSPFPEQFPEFSYSARAPVHRQADGKWLYAGGIDYDGRSHALALLRVNPDGTPDTTFGRGGLVKLTVWGAFEFAAAAREDAQGRIVMVGNTWDPSRLGCFDSQASDDCAVYNVVHRLDAAGVVDPSFHGGEALLFRQGPLLTPYYADTSEQWVSDLRFQDDGTIEVVADWPGSRGARVVAHVRPDGTLDDAFVPSGPAPQAADFPVAIELYNERLDRYFVTSDRSEIHGLDRRPEVGWTWMGSGFRNFASPPWWIDTVPACRFYGLPEAGLDSHVLSIDAAECAVLSGSPAWLQESAAAFHVPAPDQASGACPHGFRPVYRLWHSGQGHHLTASTSVRDRLVARGFVAEGFGPDAVAMCGM